MELRNTTIDISGITYNVIVNEYLDDRRILKCYRLEVTELSVFYNFSVDPFLHSKEEDFYPYLNYHLSYFKCQIELTLFNPSNYTYCTKELILEKYFESYIYSVKNRYQAINPDLILKNPNLILGRRKGHTQALVDFVTDTRNQEIIRDSFIVFPSLSLVEEFRSRLDEITRRRVSHNIITYAHHTRGRSSSFFIFNNYSLISDEIPQYMNQNPYVKHFIVLGN